MLNVLVVSPERTLYQGEASQVVAPAWDGQVGILTNHAPMVALLGRGVLRVSGSGGEQRFNVEGGFLQVVENQLRVVTEKAESAG